MRKLTAYDTLPIDRATVPTAPAPHDSTIRDRRGDELKARATKVHIYRPARSVMQAGGANAKHWVLEFEPRLAPFIEPLMGWTGSRDTLQQVRLKFPTKESAVAFAESQGWTYSVAQPHEPRLRPKPYADNFRFDHPRYAAKRSEPETAMERAARESVLHGNGSTPAGEDRGPVDPVEEALLESFPASDPPSWTGTALK